ncbi:hypothetical protein [Anaeromicropila populeti]|uniref:Uncharacterized protein n=1 Tax=Anaeromicropila populeti TaxID=37658 RepID=A0A1I6INL9_9FIRM|nr:hypothetical protein [Anaeromicropila populeti]SFR68345.1 hypothetical protein SAMN05661086_00952 [Anaeromicropila populeti]
MKLKYKKIVLLITLGTMFIGFVTLSLSKPVKNKSKADSVETSAGQISVDSTEFTKQTYEGEAGEIILEKDAYDEVNQLVKDYLNARVRCDMDALSSLVSDVSYLSEKTLQEKSEYIEGYQNIECYTVKGLEEDSYIVYVYSEVKILDIDTPAPGLTSIYIRKTDDDKLCVYFGVLDEETQNYMKEAAECEGVQELIRSVDNRFTEALQKDEKLNEFDKKLENSAKNSNS